MTARPLFALIVAAAHIALIVWWATMSHRSRVAVPDEFVTTLLGIVPTPNTTAPPPHSPASRANTPRAVAPQPLAAPAATPPVGTSITIDRWYDSASEAANAQVAGAADQERRAASMGQAAIAARSLAESPRKAPPDFAWSSAHTKRIERTEDGATILRLSERCILVNFILPFCDFTKQEANGDLFDDMNAAPEMGDWKD